MQHRHFSSAIADHISRLVLGAQVLAGMDEQPASIGRSALHRLKLLKIWPRSQLATWPVNPDQTGGDDHAPAAYVIKDCVRLAVVQYERVGQHQHFVSLKLREREGRYGADRGVRSQNRIILNVRVDQEARRAVVMRVGWVRVAQSRRGS